MDIVYYVACSLDGYIATTDGGVEWLDPFQGGDEDYGFGDFYASVDALLMGSVTYEFALAHPPWMCPDKPGWVFTSRDLPVGHSSITLTSDEPRRIIDSLSALGMRSAWLMGGGELAASFRAENLISRYMLAVIPVVLGGGIPLFAEGGQLEQLELIEARPYPDGVMQLTYEPATR